MLDRPYFESVLPEQIRMMEKPVRLTLTLVGGAEKVVHAVVSVADAHIVLQVYTEGEGVQHSEPWLQSHAGQEAEIFDQLALPYGIILTAHLTARASKDGTDARSLIGFQQDQPA